MSTHSNINNSKSGEGFSNGSDQLNSQNNQQSHQKQIKESVMDKNNLMQQSNSSNYPSNMMPQSPPAPPQLQPLISSNPSNPTAMKPIPPPNITNVQFDYRQHQQQQQLQQQQQQHITSLMRPNNFSANGGSAISSRTASPALNPPNVGVNTNPQIFDLSNTFSNLSLNQNTTNGHPTVSVASSNYPNVQGNFMPISNRENPLPPPPTQQQQQQQQQQRQQQQNLNNNSSSIVSQGSSSLSDNENRVQSKVMPSVNRNYFMSPPPPPPSRLSSNVYEQNQRIAVQTNPTIDNSNKKQVVPLPLTQSQFQSGRNLPININQERMHYHHPPPHQQQQQQQQYPRTPSQAYAAGDGPPQLEPRGAHYNITKSGFNKLWGQDIIDLMQNRHILPNDKVQPPKIVLNNQFHESVNCNPDIMRCTLNKIPESNNLLQKSRLPLGILVHPFRDLNNLPVIQCPNIVRCRLCRTYINPFVYFVDSKMWKCNLCYRVNELPDDFQFDPATKTYGDASRRPEVRSSTIEFIAPSEYMLRPPQPSIYLFLLDVSIMAQQSGYLEVVCETLLKYLEDIPGDVRTKIGFIAFNSEIHFYNMAEGYNQPHELTLVDIDDPFIPRPDNLLVNLMENKELIRDLLTILPTRFAHTHDSGSALGSALQVAYKLMMSTGGRVTVFQTCLPNKGPGALQAREDPNNRSSKEIMHLNPATDFYKRHALECSGYQIAVDLFVLNQQYCDLATISGVSKYSGGSIYHFPLYQKAKFQYVFALKQCFKRYLTRKIGFEAVMRIRCTRGLQVHTFHGNFFVRSTDLLSLPNVNPDAGYGMQISYDENLTDIKTICFQSALLYTNSEGERRIRVHTLCLPVSSNLQEVMFSADSQAIVGLLSKMAVDRCMSSSVSDARDAFINAIIDTLNAFKTAQNLPQGQSGQLLLPKNLSLLPLYISAILKHVAFRIGKSTRLDDRVAAMDKMKTLPLDQLMKNIYPECYKIDVLFSEMIENEIEKNPPILQLSAEFLDSRSMFLIDCGTLIIIYIGLNVPQTILEGVLGVQSTSEIPDFCYGLTLINTPQNNALRNFLNKLNEDKPYQPVIQIMRDTSACRNMFVEMLYDDRSESSLSYYEFLQHLRSQIK